MKRAFFVTLLVLSLQSCALFSKGEVTTRRYFSPDLPAAQNANLERRTDLQLRLARVSANRTLSERIMYRDSEHEVGFYDDLVWTERPEAYLARGLTRVLFEERGLRSIVGGPGPTLDVELVRFEEVKAPAHVARVRITFTLSDERLVSVQKTLNLERPIAATTAKEALGPALAEAMGEALRDAISELSSVVMAELAKTPAPVKTTAR